MTQRYATSDSFDGYPTVELHDYVTDSRVVVCPQRGGIMTQLRLRGRELLYLDRGTFLDPQANIRGGNPILFPIAGRLRDGQYAWNGHTCAMPAHGVARIMAWTETGRSATDHEGAALTLALHANEQSLAAFPFQFELRFTYRLKDGGLALEQTYLNHAGEAMPMTAGFHPYFAAADKDIVYITEATRQYDALNGRIKPFAGKLTDSAFDTVLLDVNAPAFAFALPDGATVRLSYSEQFRYVVLWTLEDRPFVCVEPWTARPDALNTKEDLLLVPPGEALKLDMRFDLIGYANGQKGEEIRNGYI